LVFKIYNFLVALVLLKKRIIGCYFINIDLKLLNYSFYRVETKLIV